MKKHLLASLFLVVIAVFYFSFVGMLVSLYLLVTEPSLIYLIFVGVCAVVVTIYAIFMKFRPGFRALVVGFLENHPM